MDTKFKKEIDEILKRSGKEFKKTGTIKPKAHIVGDNRKVNGIPLLLSTFYKTRGDMKMTKYNYKNIKPFSKDFVYDFTYPMEFHNLELDRHSIEYRIACIKACAHSVAFREADDPDDALLQVSTINDMIHELELLLNE